MDDQTRNALVARLSEARERESTLGRRLLVHVSDIMRKGEQLPRTAPDALLPQAIVEMTAKGIGMTVIVDANDRILGIFTGELARGF